MIRAVFFYLSAEHGNFAETFLRDLCPPRVAEGGKIFDFDGRIVINIVVDPQLFILKFSTFIIHYFYGTSRMPYPTICGSITLITGDNVDFHLRFVNGRAWKPSPTIFNFMFDYRRLRAYSFAFCFSGDS